ncbi:PKD domain-containing protein [Shivajiella indica]|uniref:PKD domain-containing protein n=1 Tax=Shivajiella indica TaxID=872115 RepID=A0ABW5B6B2_9BACT
MSKGYYFILFFLVFLFGSKAFAQLTTVGKEFRFGFMENNRVVDYDNPGNSALDYGIVVITAAEPATGIIQYGNRSVNFDLNTGDQFFYRIEDMDILHRASGVVENKGVYINSSGDVSVYAFNERLRSADGTVVLPITSLGKEYYVVSHFEIMTAPTNFPYSPNVNDESLLLVVAVEDNTRIQITPSVFTLSGNPAAIPFEISLNSGQSYQIKAKADLTGTRVRVVGDNVDDCKNIAVFGGNKWTSVGNCGGANDHLFQHMYPVTTWGTDYLHVSLRGRTSGEMVKVLASENNTSVLVDGVNVGNLNAGRFLTLNFEQNEVKRITTDKPSLVTVFSKSQECNDPGSPLFEDGDPFMMSYSPNQQLLQSVTFNAIQLPEVRNHYVNIIVPSAASGLTRLDGQNIGNQFTPFPQYPDFSYARLNIPQGVHRLDNSEGFIAYVYGFGVVESYGYAVGAALSNLNFETEPTYEFEVQGEKVACLNQEGTWEIFPENELFTYFLWDFGDGSPLKEGKQVKHTYGEIGVYEIKVIASLSINSCDQQEEVKFNVNVQTVEGEIIGLTSVCPEVEEITYSFRSPEEFSKVEWKQEGGEIIDLNEEEGLVTIRWGKTNPDAFVLAIPFTMEGCPMAEVQLQVNINPVIISEIPTGETEICYNPEGIFEYRVQNQYANRKYFWMIEGGEIIGENDLPVINVRWAEGSTRGTIWFQESSLLDDLCEGESPRLEVIINPKLEIEEQLISNVLCFGESNGNITIKPKGGTPPYSFSWSHDVNLNSGLAENLSSGIYALKITDSFGCEIIINDLEIVQPEILETVSLSLTPTSCFGRSDGETSIIVRGGTAPYSIDYPFAIISGNEIKLPDLEGQEYDFEVRDANGCSIPISFVIDSPEPYMVDVNIEKPSCPGQNNGKLIVLPDNQFGPYIYLWDFDNSGNQILENVPRGVYNVTVTDRRGCQGFGIGEMKESTPLVRMPTGYRLDEGLFSAVSNCDLDFTLSVFNRWGQLIYSGDSGWDGKYGDTPVPLGTYSYLFQYVYNLNGEVFEKEIRGVFTIIR